MGGLFDNFWTSRVSISMDKRNFGCPRYVFEVQFGHPVAIERKWESSEGNFTRTKAKIGVKIRRIRRFGELCDYHLTVQVWSVFIIWIKNLCLLSYSKCALSRFWSDCLIAETDLNLHWAHIADVAARMFLIWNKGTTIDANTIRIKYFFWHV